MGCRSRARIIRLGELALVDYTRGGVYVIFWERTCDQEPGAAHRSITRVTSAKLEGSVWWGKGRVVGDTLEQVKLLVQLQQLEG
jgi:hypothetical protein